MYENVGKIFKANHAQSFHNRNRRKSKILLRFWEKAAEISVKRRPRNIIPMSSCLE